MSCARIRNKPVKFLDPQEKVIVELKHEIKRLKVENRKLRTTLLTAPSTLSLNHHGFSDDEATVLSSPSFRALSAHNIRGGSKLSSQQELIDRRKKNKQQPGKSKKIKKSDIFAKYPQLNSILQKEQKQRGGNVDSRLRPQLKSVIDSYTSLNSESSVRDSVNDGPKRRISVEVLDEMVHRRASGPLIFKDPTSPIPSIIDQVANKYNPADNYRKQMDKKVNRLLNETPANENRIKPDQDDDPAVESQEEDNEDKKNSKSNYKVIDAEQLLKKKTTKKKIVKKSIPKRREYTFFA
jgi:hypothetical protein